MAFTASPSPSTRPRQKTSSKKPLIKKSTGSFNDAKKVTSTAPARSPAHVMAMPKSLLQKVHMYSQHSRYFFIENWKKLHITLIQ